MPRPLRRHRGHARRRRPAPSAAAAGPPPVGGTLAVEALDLHLPVPPGRAPPAAAEELGLLAAGLARRAGVPTEAVEAPRVTRRSLDVRGGRVRLACSLEARLPARAAQSLIAAGRARPPRAAPAQAWAWPAAAAPPSPPPVVVGAGPAGLFAALTLAEAGLPPVVVERGQPVEVRARAVAQLYARGVLDPESNVCFGEGGAGTFSDGKLYTRVGDPRAEQVLAHLVRFGAPARIQVDARPHVGTDRLVVLLRAMRRHLQARGVRFVFGARVVGFTREEGRVRGVMLADGTGLAARAVVVATGHSAADIWQLLLDAGARLEPRPFAVGFRVEHPQALIGALRHGAAAAHLPAADYRLVYNEAETRGQSRGVWSFCMCPGGVVVPTPTRDGGLCLNGMSHASRSGRFANSALVVAVSPQDLADWGYSGLWAGHQLVRDAEARAHAAGGGAFRAPACRLTDFAAGRAMAPLGPTSYRRGLQLHPLDGLYPPAVTAALRRALADFGRQIPGFVSDAAQLIGVETRTASPVRALRDQGCQAVGLAGLYPSGEGMGWGGGIVSAAVDGMRVAEALLCAAGARRVPAAAG